MNRWEVATKLLLCGYVMVGADLALGVEGIELGSGSSGSTSAQESVRACRVDVDAFNRDRYVRQEVHVECPGEVSTKPWGNWGVESLFSYRWDGNQYQGWKDIQSGWREWNSCTKGDWNSGSAWYNAHAPWNDEQETNQGDNRYGSMSFLLFPEDEEDGCDAFDGYNLTITNNWFEAWELDDFPLNPDDFVDGVTYGSFVIELSCWYSGCNPSWSNAMWALGNGGVISQEVQARVNDAYLYWVDEDPGECDPCEI